MKYIDVDHLRAAIKEHTLFYAGQANLLDGTNTLDGYDEVLAIIDSLQQEQPEVFDSVAFQKGVQEGRRLEREDVKSTIQSRIDEILGDAQPNPVLRMELQELIKKIEA